MIRTENLSMVFTTEDVQTRALSNVNLEIKQGEFVAIMGPSGCGKSTLLNILGTLDIPTSGKYFINEKEMTKMNENQLSSFRKKNIGFVFQSFNLIDELTVFENVELPMVYSKVPEAERVKRATEALEKVGLKNRMYHQPNQLSGGQQQRVAIARAVVNEAPIIFADEPTGNLDTKMSVEIMDLFTRLNKELGRTIILVTHEEDIAKYADRIIKIVDGEISSDERNCK